MIRTSLGAPINILGQDDGSDGSSGSSDGVSSGSSGGSSGGDGGGFGLGSLGSLVSGAGSALKTAQGAYNSITGSGTSKAGAQAKSGAPTTDPYFSCRNLKGLAQTQCVHNVDVAIKLRTIAQKKPATKTSGTTIAIGAVVLIGGALLAWKLI